MHIKTIYILHPHLSKILLSMNILDFAHGLATHTSKHVRLGRFTQCFIHFIYEYDGFCTWPCDIYKQTCALGTFIQCFIHCMISKTLHISKLCSSIAFIMLHTILCVCVCVCVCAYS